MLTSIKNIRFTAQALLFRYKYILYMCIIATKNVSHEVLMSVFLKRKENIFGFQRYSGTVEKYGSEYNYDCGISYADFHCNLFILFAKCEVFMIWKFYNFGYFHLILASLQRILQKILNIFLKICNGTINLLFYAIIIVFTVLFSTYYVSMSCAEHSVKKKF